MTPAFTGWNDRPQQIFTALIPVCNRCLVVDNTRIWILKQSFNRSNDLSRPIKRRYLIIAGLTILPCMVYLWARDPSEQGLTPPCLFFTLTGLQCPGCGTLRALHQLFNGNISAAFWLNPLIFLSAPFIAYAFLIMGPKRFRMKLPEIALNPSLVIFLCLVVVDRKSVV